MTSSDRGLIIAIDGPSASGKTTTARAVAERLKYLHIDTGAMYRALALKAGRKRVNLGDSKTLEAFLAKTSIDCVAKSGSFRVLLDGVDVTDELRDSDVSLKSSEIAAMPKVRHWLVARQRTLAAKGAVVMEGRDIGTVVLPDADLKIYLDAGPEERAKRRWLEEAGEAGRSREDVLKELSQRDSRDMTRRHSPLRAAADAVTIDTTTLTVDEQVEAVLKEIERIMRSRGA